MKLELLKAVMKERLDKKWFAYTCVVTFAIIIAYQVYLEFSKIEVAAMFKLYVLMFGGLLLLYILVDCQAVFNEYRLRKTREERQRYLDEQACRARNSGG